MNNNKFQDYLVDMVFLLKEKALILKNEAPLNEDMFKKGELMGYHDILSIMIEQANLFKINLSDIGLNNFDPDTDLL